MQNKENPYGDGHAARQIAEVVDRLRRNEELSFVEQ
jgi:UDP-N-acetylglucosamine 2-epimerase